MLFVKDVKGLFSSVVHCLLNEKCLLLLKCFFDKGILNCISDSQPAPSVIIGPQYNWAPI